MVSVTVEPFDEWRGQVFGRERGVLLLSGRDSDPNACFDFPRVWIIEDSGQVEIEEAGTWPYDVAISWLETVLVEIRKHTPT